MKVLTVVLVAICALFFSTPRGYSRQIVGKRIPESRIPAPEYVKNRISMMDDYGRQNDTLWHQLGDNYNWVQYARDTHGVEASGIRASMADSLTSIFFLRVYPGSSGRPQAEVVGEKLWLWHPSGYLWEWNWLHTQMEIYIMGYRRKANEVVVNGLLPADYLFSLYLLPSERYYLRYTAKMSGNRLLIYDMEGRCYQSIGSLIRTRFGTMKKYAQAYGEDMERYEVQ